MEWNNDQENSFQRLLFVHCGYSVSNVRARSIMRVRSFLLTGFFEWVQLLCFEKVFTVGMHGYSSKVVLNDFELLMDVFKIINSSKHERILFGELRTFQVDFVNILNQFVNFDDLLKSFSYELMVLGGEVEKFLPYSGNLPHFLIVWSLDQIGFIGEFDWHEGIPWFGE